MKPLSITNHEAHKEIIVTLIQADLTHHQLVGNLRKMELHTDRYELPIYEAVAQLMGIGKEPDQEWFDIYDGFLLKAHTHAIAQERDQLRPVAEECYELLCASVKLKRHLQVVP